MERWEADARFVQEKQQSETEFMFREDDTNHTERKKHDEFVREWGFSTFDILDLDQAIAMFILPRLRYYITKTDSIPNELLKTNKAGNILNETEAFQKWKQILHAICDGLHLYISKYNTGFSEEEQTLWKTAKKYLFEYFEHLWI